MSWPSGITKQKTGGRKKGTPNRRTNELQHRFEQLQFDALNEFVEAFSKLTPKDKVQSALQLFTFIYPRRKALEIEEKEDEPTDSAAKTQQAERLLERLKTIYREDAGRDSRSRQEYIGDTSLSADRSRLDL